MSQRGVAGRRKWILVGVLAMAGLPGVTRGSIPEDPVPPKLWEARYSRPANLDGHPRALAVSPDGSKVFVTGASDGSGYWDNEYATVAYDATGALLWAARYQGLGEVDNFASALAVSPDGSRVFVTGMSGGTEWGDYDYATVAYDADTGRELWVTRYDSPGAFMDEATALALAPDGSRVYVTGTTWDARRPDQVAGWATVAYDARTGAELWVASYNGPGNSSDVATSLAVSPDGSKVFVTGYGGGSASPSDYVTLAYSTATGSEIWTARYNGPANVSDSATSLAVSPDGSKVIVTGCSGGSDSSSDYATIAYSAASGAELWVARYNGPANLDDRATSLAVSPDGSKVFVTGGSDGSDYGSDYATVAYRATSCASGQDEVGPVSRPAHEQVEPLAGPPGAPYVHGVSCDVLVPNGL